MGAGQKFRGSGSTMAMVTLAPSRRLLDAAKHGDVEGCLAAAGAGADVNGGDPAYGGYTAMHLVAENGHAVCLKWLAEAGAPLDARSKSGESALHWAAEYGFADCIKVL